MEVEISNPWVLDYGVGWRWLGLVGQAGFFWVLVGVGYGHGDRCGRGDWCGSWICVYRFGCRWVFLGFYRVGGR